MDSTILVSPSQQDSVKLLERLDASGVPIEAAYWYWDPDAESDRLILASPLVDKFGPRVLYERIQSTLRADQPLRLDLSEITVLSPDAHIVQALGRAIWAAPGGIARASAAGVGPNGPFLDVVVLRPLHKDPEAFRSGTQPTQSAP